MSGEGLIDEGSEGALPFPKKEGCTIMFYPKCRVESARRVLDSFG
jgi:hypothetical protein